MFNRLRKCTEPSWTTWKAPRSIIMAAAVADYRPARAADQKIKKNGDKLLLELEQTEDILAEFGGAKSAQVVIGFAAETENLLDNARKKLLSKRADLIVANDVSSNDAGFDVDTNRIALVTEVETTELPSALQARGRRPNTRFGPSDKRVTRFCCPLRFKAQAVKESGSQDMAEMLPAGGCGVAFFTQVSRAP